MRGNRLKAFVVLLGLILATVLPLAIPLRGPLTALLTRIHGAGLAGALLYALAYTLATILFLPGSVLTLGAGFAYGVVAGTVLVSIASTLGALLAFLLGRGAVRRRIERRVAASPRFAAIDEAVGREGFKIVFLLRLSPVFPFNLLNYALGLTRVGLRDYLIASWVGMLPGTLLYVYLGSLAGSAAEILSGSRAHGGIWSGILFWGGLAATVAVTVLLTRIARRALGDALDGGPRARCTAPATLGPRP